ncbi:hypothetical protein PMAYCL1PPCAC_27241, partial [Pristionchus mayeri]
SLHSPPPIPTMQFVLTTALISALVPAVVSQCTGADSSSCVSWVKNGYCTNTASSMDQRKLYCGVACGFCNKDGTQTAAGGSTTVICLDNNANCASWAATGFCTNPTYSDAMKKQYCCKTCTDAAATTPPTTTCGVIYMGSSILVNTPPTTAQQTITNASPLTRVFVKTGCSLKMYTDPAPTHATGSPFTGADAFVTLTGTAASTLGSASTFFTYECTCP